MSTSNLRWMPEYEEVVPYDTNAQTQATSKSLLQAAEVICCLDFNALHRIKGLGALSTGGCGDKSIDRSSFRARILR
jgi:phosphoesterase RecJ-like protein